MNKNIVCCLCVRNCEKYLKDIFRNLDLLGNTLECLNFYIIFVYDNCIDNSAILINEYKKNSKFKVIVINNENNNSEFRPVRIANSRNICLYIIENKIKNIDFHIFIDADDVNISIWDVDIIKGYIDNADNINDTNNDTNNNYNNDWDILSFNRYNYYDIWALLYEDFKHQCWGFNTEIVITHMQTDIENKLKNMDDNKLFECYSAFNGFAIYRTKKLNKIFYDGTYDSYKNLFNEEEKIKTINKFKTKSSLLNNLYIIHREDCCEHLYYNIMATRNNNARVKISKKILQKK